MDDKALCAICGEPMPAGETMFKYHGYSGPCPKPPLLKPPAPMTPDEAFTAGALAMKEAAIQSCEGRKDSVLFRGMSSDGLAATLCGAQAAAYDYAIEDIRALPVPPRGSKI